MEEMLMMRPPSTSFMCGITALEQRNAPLALTSMLVSQASSSVSSIGFGASKAPALLTKISIRPNTRFASSTMDRI
jgi:hypothetical protein